MSTNHKQSNHYSNCLILTQDGNPLSIIGDKRFNWYLKRGLAHEVKAHPPYSRIAKLNFKNKQSTIKDTDLTVNENRCVICGATETLSLHHVVPHAIKKCYSEKHKNYTRHLCVLVCEKHHLETERLYNESLVHPYQKFSSVINIVNNFVTKIFNYLRPLYYKWWIFRNGGVNKINKRYIDLFLKMEPKYLPKGWLK